MGTTGLAGERVMIRIEWKREFQIWNYAFSYSELLLRSAPRFDGDKRVDVLFSNVKYMNLSVHLSGLAVEEVETVGELPWEPLGLPDEPFRCFLLNCGPEFIVANNLKWHEDHEWVDAPSRFGPFRGVQ